MDKLQQPFSTRISARRPGCKSATLLVLGLLLGGCGNDMADLQLYVEEVKARKHAPIDPIPVIKPYEAFVYPEHTRDPFDARVLERQAKVVSLGRDTGDIQPPTEHVPEYLESFPLDTLRMVGTLSQDGMLWALIKTPDGTIQRVTTGNYMGQNFGKITRISDAGIDLEEIIPDVGGSWSKRPGSIALSE